MQISAQYPLPNLQSLNQNHHHHHHHHHHHLCFIFSSHIYADPLKATPRTSLHFSIQTKNKTLKPTSPFKTLQCRVKTFESKNSSQSGSLEKFNFDAFLSVLEILCLVPSAVVSIGFLGWKKSSWFQFQAVSGTVNRVFLWQFVFLAGAVVVGAVIRRRQWSRVCRDSNEVNDGLKSSNLVERVEKLEEDLRSSVTIIRVLSRRLEKLGIRFRVTRKALKQPIDETAALAQKNSEATRALAIQEDILEKELGEIQKVLLAMQEHQQKQLELIVAIAKAGKLRYDTTPESVSPVQQEQTSVQSKSDAKNEGHKQQQRTQTSPPAQTTTGHKGANNDRS